MNLSREEQEVIFSSSRTDDMMECYTTDPTYMTKMEKLVAKNPELFACDRIYPWTQKRISDLVGKWKHS